MKPNRTWVLIADGGHASGFETQANHSDLAPVEDMTFSVNLPASILSDRPGRSFESPRRTSPEAEGSPEALKGWLSCGQQPGRTHETSLTPDGARPEA
jgi:hypothetical protein